MSCTICEHAQRLNIEVEVRAGKTALATAAKYGISRQALGRHIRKGHVPPDPSLPSTSGAPSPPQGAALVSAEELLREAIVTLRAIDITTLSPSQKSGHIESFRRLAEALNGIAAPPAVDNHLRDALAAAEDNLRLISTVLEDFPEAKAALAAALKLRRQEAT